MDSCEELLEQLEKFKQDRRNEYPLRPIEKWMIERLGVNRLRNTGGSAVRYEHPALAELKGDGIFTIHLARGGKHEMIYRRNFKNFLYRPLLHIISYLRKEGICGD